jgi:hypothetical protein
MNPHPPSPNHFKNGLNGPVFYCRAPGSGSIDKTAKKAYTYLLKMNTVNDGFYRKAFSELLQI